MLLKPFEKKKKVSIKNATFKQFNSFGIFKEFFGTFRIFWNFIIFLEKLTLSDNNKI